MMLETPRQASVPARVEALLDTQTDPAHPGLVSNRGFEGAQNALTTIESSPQHVVLGRSDGGLLRERFQQLRNLLVALTFPEQSKSIIPLELKTVHPISLSISTPKTLLNLKL